MLTTAYFDESETGQTCHGVPILTVAGFISTIERWQDFEVDWKLLLAKNGIKELHQKTMWAPGSPFRNWSKERKRIFDRDVTSIVHRYALASICCGVVLEDWKDFKSRFKVGQLTPYILCTVSSIVLAWDWCDNIRRPIPHHMLNFVFDRSPQAGRLLNWNEHQSPPQMKHLKPTPMSFGDSEHLPPLQAADWLVGEFRRFLECYEARDWNKNLRQSFVSLLRVQNLNGIYRSKNLEKLATRWPLLAK